MAEKKRDWESTVARIAGNLLSGDSRAFHISINGIDASEPATILVNSFVVKGAVATARAIVAEVERTSTPDPRKD